MNVDLSSNIVMVFFFLVEKGLLEKKCNVTSRMQIRFVVSRDGPPQSVWEAEYQSGVGEDPMVVCSGSNAR